MCSSKGEWLAIAQIVVPHSHWRRRINKASLLGIARLPRISRCFPVCDTSDLPVRPMTLLSVCLESHLYESGAVAHTAACPTIFLLLSQRKGGSLSVGNPNDEPMKQKADVLQGTWR
jgi:hypothetical protein